MPHSRDVSSLITVMPLSTTTFQWILKTCLFHQTLFPRLFFLYSSFRGACASNAIIVRGERVWLARLVRIHWNVNMLRLREARDKRAGVSFPALLSSSLLLHVRMQVSAQRVSTGEKGLASKNTLLLQRLRFMIESHNSHCYQPNDKGYYYKSLVGDSRVLFDRFLKGERRSLAAMEILKICLRLDFIQQIICISTFWCTTGGRGKD